MQSIRAYFQPAAAAAGSVSTRATTVTFHSAATSSSPYSEPVSSVATSPAADPSTIVPQVGVGAAAAVADAFAPRKLVHVAVIGTAGRKEDGPKMSAELFESMVAHAEYVQHTKWKLENEQVVLVSGGAAWADHVVLALYQRALQAGRTPYAGLQIFMPCEFVETNSTYRAVDTGGDWKVNPGWLVNKQHDQFSRVMNRNTMEDFKLAAADRRFRLDCTIRGMHARDAAIARVAQRMLAMTWGDGDCPKPGGTLHTWNLCKLPAQFKVHVPLKGLRRQAVYGRAAHGQAAHGQAAHRHANHRQAAHGQAVHDDARVVIGYKRPGDGLKIPAAKASRIEGGSTPCIEQKR